MFYINPHAKPIQSLANWLFVCAALIFVMIVIGGATRLTGSGLSIVDWKLISGILPPLNTAAWIKSFEAYQQSPEYQKITYGMTLGHYQQIFWLEYVHRLWGRLIGLIFLIPIIKIAFHPLLRRLYLLKIMALWGLIGIQGIIGWYMVKSGLIKEPHVSHYRLALHLMLGFITFGLTLYFGLKIRFEESPLPRRLLPWSQHLSHGLLFILLMITIFYGALVAGLKAGLIYNTFPTMDGRWVPYEIFTHQPLWRDLIDNPATIQWIHRCLALTMTVVTSTFCWFNRQDFACLWLLVGIGVQVTLGILTLLFHVPLYFALLHQIMALILLTILIILIFYKNIDCRPIQRINYE